MSSLRRATAVMSLGTVLSRATGVGRLAAVAAALGIVESGRLADTYHLGNTAPNIIYELVLGGVLTSVFVPVFVELLEKEGRERAWEVASAIMNVSIVVLTAVTTIGVLAAPWIARLYATRAGDEQALQEDVLTFLLRLFVPQIIFYGLYALTAGFLNAHKRFGPPMYTPILNNLAVIAIFVAFHQAYGGIERGLAGVTTTQLWIIGGGTTAGVALQALANLPWLRGLGRYRLTFSLAHPATRKLARLSVFVIGYVVSNQIGYLIVQWLANGQTGGYAAYVAAFTFFMLPHGLFAVSVITALLPGMSELALDRQWDTFRSRLGTGIRATFLLILPAAVGYLLLAEPIVRLFLEHGVMQASSVELVAGVLRFFVLGLVPFSMFQLLLRAFYAMQNTKTPFLVNCGAVALNTAVNVPMFALLRVEGLAAGHALAYVFGVAVLSRALSRRIGGLGGRALVASAARIGLAAGGMGVAVWAALTAVSAAVDDSTLAGQVAVVAVPVGAGLVAYFALGTWLRLPELDFVRRALARRLARRP
ncbi:MAG TPA: murein biosynthesis integral membrane protein MurJ [Actinomycetota bacterium]|nr:murein biosynthesis integral membrane protein MurJ [Actinomycetota bacterium]